jgi:hypothetical protein
MYGGESMARRTVNKTKAIREHYLVNPLDKPRVIVATLKGKGIRVRPQYVSIVLTKLRKDPNLTTGGAAVKNGSSPMRGRPRSTGSMGLKELMLAKDLIRQAGNASLAKAAIDAYTDLTA